MPWPGSGALLLVIACLCMLGCGSPSAANIELRKKNQTLSDQVQKLDDQHHRDLETLAACQRSHPTTQCLSPERLQLLVTTHDLSFGRLTGGDNPDSTQAFDTQLNVAVVPLDDEGVPIKAAGTFKVEAFDLSDARETRIGTWNFDLDQSRKLFFSRFAEYTYVLGCPWQTIPVHPDLTVRVSFVEALTGREFVNQIQVKVRPRVSPKSATQP